MESLFYVTKVKSFDGIFGRIAAPIMVRKNREAEIEANEILGATQGARLLVLGFGPGVGLQDLLRRTQNAKVVGLDPSQIMMEIAAKRNAGEIDAGRLRLIQATAETIPEPEDCFDGAVAVNTIQLCEPFENSLPEIGRVLKPHAKLVTITHDWAAAKHAGSPEIWKARLDSALVTAGFSAIDIFNGKSEKGKAIVVTARWRAK